jgi:hypothetical protein
MGWGTAILALVIASHQRILLATQKIERFPTQTSTALIFWKAGKLW